jgi:acetyl-CoA/propionyl-CoA carboxylase biotin carboxyl carrier protein
MPATVTRVAVQVGRAVGDGKRLLAIEAVKIEPPMRAPRDGVVAAIHRHEGQLVHPGTVLIVL